MKNLLMAAAVIPWAGVARLFGAEPAVWMVVAQLACLLLWLSVAIAGARQ